MDFSPYSLRSIKQQNCLRAQNSSRIRYRKRIWRVECDSLRFVLSIGSGAMRFPNDGPPPPENGQQVIDRMAKLLGHAPTMRVTLRDDKGRTVAVETVGRKRPPGVWDQNKRNDR